MSNMKLSMTDAIDILQAADPNATWDECETYDGFASALRSTIEAYEDFSEYTEQLELLRNVEARLVPNFYRVTDPDSAGIYTDDTIRELYHDTVDDYDTFADWLYDMIRYGLIVEL